NNTQVSKAEYSISQEGKLIANIDIKTRGIQYNNRFYLERQAYDDLKKYYKQYFHIINNIDIKNIKLNNNKRQIEFTEKISLKSENYNQKNENRLILADNMFNQY